jgi:anti-sigma-K factor RskA
VPDAQATRAITLGCVSKPSRKRHPRRPAPFRRQWRSVSVRGVYGQRFDTVSDGDAPLTPRQALHWRWAFLGVAAVCVVALIVLGH